MEEASYIDVQNLSIHFGEYCVLENISFSSNKGEFVSLVGKSGTGKSSFLNAMAGFVKYTGKVSMPKDIGYIFQNYSLFPWLSVKENISFGLEGVTREEKNTIVSELLQRIELVNLENRYPSQLSGGQVQRVALARTIAMKSNIILADEPYGALDYHTRNSMSEWLLRILEEENKTVVFVTHSIEEAIFLSDRIIVLKNKSFIEDIQVPFARPRHSALKFSQKFINLKEEILDYM